MDIKEDEVKGYLQKGKKDNGSYLCRDNVSFMDSDCVKCFNIYIRHYQQQSLNNVS